MASQNPAATSRRERKKAATRKAISDVATRMFVERGFDRVSTKEIADAADVSPTTVFAHFPVKEALVFDEDDEMREELLSAVRDREPGTPLTTALHRYLLSSFETMPTDGAAAFHAMIAATPALSDYSKKMWLRHADGLANEVAREAGLDQPSWEIAAFAHFVVQIQLLAMEAEDAAAALAGGFRVLEQGWAPYARTVGLT